MRKKNWIYARRRMLESHLSTPLVWQWRKKGSRARNSQNEFRVFFTSWIHKTPGSSSCHCCKFLKWEKDVKVLWTRKNHQLPLIPMWIIKIFPEQLQFPVNHDIVFTVSSSFPLLISVNENLWIISHCEKVSTDIILKQRTMASFLPRTWSTRLINIENGNRTTFFYSVILIDSSEGDWVCFEI